MQALERGASVPCFHPARSTFAGAGHQETKRARKCPRGLNWVSIQLLRREPGWPAFSAQRLSSSSEQRTPYAGIELEFGAGKVEFAEVSTACTNITCRRTVECDFGSLMIINDCIRVTGNPEVTGLGKGCRQQTRKLPGAKQ